MPKAEDRGWARRLARSLHDVKDEVAREVTDEFFQRHPSWRERYGDEGVRHGVQDARFHMEFLAGAVEARSASPFASYARWIAGVLAARDIDPSFLAENLQQLRSALVGRLEEEEARALLTRILDQGIAAVEGDAPPPGIVEDSGARGVSSDLTVTGEAYLQAILSGNRRTATAVVEEALARNVDILDIYLHLIQRAQRRLGELWAANEISVAQEHMASAVTQSVLSHLYPHLPEAPVSRGVAVVTGVEGELHQIGANIVADVLEADGWKVRFLGTQLPHRGIVHRVQSEEAALVGISATMLFNLSAVAELIHDLHGLELERPPVILVGGSAFHQAGKAWKEMGADAFASDLIEARDRARALQR